MLEEDVMFGMEDPVAANTMELTVMVVEHPSLATVLKTAFDTYWQQGITFEGARSRVEKDLIQFVRSRSSYTRMG